MNTTSPIYTYFGFMIQSLLIFFRLSEGVVLDVHIWQVAHPGVTAMINSVTALTHALTLTFNPTPTPTPTLTLTLVHTRTR